MFVWGANTHGSLGLGHKTDRAVPTLLPLTAEGMLRIGDFGVTINSDDFEDGNEGDAVRALVHRDFPAPLLCARARRRRRITCILGGGGFCLSVPPATLTNLLRTFCGHNNSHLKQQQQQQQQQRRCISRRRC